MPAHKDKPFRVMERMLRARFDWLDWLFYDVIRYRTDRPYIRRHIGNEKLRKFRVRRRMDVRYYTTNDE